MKRDLIVAVLSSFCLASTLFMIMPTISSPVIGEYDPWLDINDDGKIDIKDIAASARAFGTLGDPTKNVTVTNWPVSVDTAVWWEESLSPSVVLWSDDYNASGLGHLHILTAAGFLSGAEEVYVHVYGHILGPSGSDVGVRVHELTLADTSNTASVTIPVPSGTFRFRVEASPITDATFYLGFYLTWA